MGSTGESLLAEIYIVNLKTAITVGIEDSIYTVITCFKLVNIVTCTTFKIVTAFATIKKSLPVPEKYSHY